MNLIGALRGPLVAAEEEQLVADDVTTRYAAKLVALQSISFGGSPGVEIAVAEEFEEIAMEITFVPDLVTAF